MKVFVAGPVFEQEHRGETYRSFQSAWDVIDRLGAEDGTPSGCLHAASWSEFVRYALAGLGDADAVIVLSGWSAARSARFVVAVASELQLDFLGEAEPSGELSPVVVSRCGACGWRGPGELFSWHKVAAGHDQRRLMPPPRLSLVGGGERDG